MKIQRLIIPDHRNLKSLDLQFHSEEPVTVLLGRNGAGKSNLIEAIVEIFRELEGARPTSFAYEINYQCHGHQILVHNNPRKSSRRLTFEVDGESKSAQEWRALSHEYLPAHVFAYYSGWTSRLERAFEPPTRTFYRSLLRNKDMPFRRFFYCRKEYSQLALLAFLLYDSTASKRLLTHYLGISDFQSALIALKRPWWAGTGRGRAGTDTEPQIWNAMGAFLPFLRRLWDVALAPIRNSEEVTRPVPRESEQTERIYLYLKDLDTLAQLKEPFESAKTFFGNLEAMFLCDLIDYVRILVRKADGTMVTISQLSEGEQQLLTVLGLLQFTRDDEAIYLLDEPDTHLNPVWTYEFLDLINDCIQGANGQLIVATHNPLMIGSLRKEQVRVISGGEAGSRASEPEYDPIGMGVEGLLKSELFGLQSTLSVEVLAMLSRHYELLGVAERSDAEQAELMQLAIDLNRLGVSRTHPNPYFELFASAMARRSPPIEGGISKEEFDAQVKLSDEILSELVAEDLISGGGKQ